MISPAIYQIGESILTAKTAMALLTTSFSIGCSACAYFLLYRFLKTVKSQTPDKILPQADKKFTSHKRFKIEEYYEKQVSILFMSGMTVYFVLAYLVFYRNLSDDQNSGFPTIDISKQHEVAQNSNIFLQPFLIFTNRPIQFYELIICLALGGYELFDLIWCYIYDGCDKVMYFHHVCTIILMHLCIMNGTGGVHFTTFICALYCSSNMPLYIRWYAKLYGNMKLDDQMTVAFVITFTLVRTIIGGSIHVLFITSGLIKELKFHFKLVIWGGLMLNSVFQLQIFVALYEIIKEKVGKKKKRHPSSE